MRNWAEQVHACKQKGVTCWRITVYLIVQYFSYIGIWWRWRMAIHWRIGIFGTYWVHSCKYEWRWANPTRRERCAEWTIWGMPSIRALFVMFLYNSLSHLFYSGVDLFSIWLCPAITNKHFFQTAICSQFVYAETEFVV